MGEPGRRSRDWYSWRALLLHLRLGSGGPAARVSGRPRRGPHVPGLLRAEAAACAAPPCGRNSRPPFLPCPPSPRPASRGSPRGGGGVHRGRGGRGSQGRPRRGLLLFLLRSPAASPSRAPRSRSPGSLRPHGPSKALTRGLSPTPRRPRSPTLPVLPALAVTVPGGSDAEPGGRSCAGSDSGRRRRRREEREAAPRADGAKKDPRARRSRSYTISVST